MCCFLESLFSGGLIKQALEFEDLQLQSSWTAYIWLIGQHPQTITNSKHLPSETSLLMSGGNKNFRFCNSDIARDMKDWFRPRNWKFREVLGQSTKGWCVFRSQLEKLMSFVYGSNLNKLSVLECNYIYILHINIVNSHITHKYTYINTNIQCI